MQGQIIKGYKLLKKLGSGATANVWMAKKDGQDFALKIYKESDKTAKVAVRNEIVHGAQIQHESIITPREAFASTDSDFACISYEYATGGELFNYVAGDKRMSSRVAKYYSL